MNTPIEIRRDKPDEDRLLIAEVFERTLLAMATDEDDDKGIAVGINAYYSVNNDLRGLLKAVVDIHNEHAVAIHAGQPFDFERMRKQVGIIAGSAAMAVGGLIANYRSEFDLDAAMVIVNKVNPGVDTGDQNSEI